MKRIILSEVMHLSPVEAVIRGDNEAPDFIPGKVRGILDRLIAGEPIQYIFGKARFCGIELEVSPAVLIPRPETEQLVDIITDMAGKRSDLKVLDCGTGSGCIAIALARALHFADITAIDISGEALQVATRNAEAYGVKIDLKQADILNEASLPRTSWDIIVSNPPYVLDSERVGIERHVIEHEPHSALFVPDSDPLRFYNAILDYAASHLAANGNIFFEINPLEADKFCEAALRRGFSRTDITSDLHGRRRFAIISR